MIILKITSFFNLKFSKLKNWKTKNNLKYKKTPHFKKTKKKNKNIIYLKIYWSTLNKNKVEYNKIKKTQKTQSKKAKIKYPQEIKMISLTPTSTKTPKKEECQKIKKIKKKNKY